MKSFFFSSCVALLFLFACQAEDILQIDSSIQTPVKEESLLLIDRETVNLTQDDAQKVALLFQNLDNTRSNRNIEVKSIKTIMGKENIPIAYVVNFSKGFVIVSATKLYNPILAFSDEGTINDDFLSHKGLEYWFSMMDEKMIRHRVALAKDSLRYWECRNKWQRYEKSDAITNTSSVIKNHVYWFPITKDYIMNKGAAWSMDRQQFCYVLQSKYHISESLDYLDRIDSELHRNYVNTGYVPPSFVWGECYNGKTIKKIDPLLQTYWGRRVPYNKYRKNNNLPLSCSSVAIGQILNYRSPMSIDGVKIDWTKTKEPYLLPNSLNTEIPKLLALLDSTIVKLSFENVVSDRYRDYVYDSFGIEVLLRRNGYFVTVKRSNKDDGISSLIFDEIKNYNPVYVEVNTTSVGINTTILSFVCDGYYEEWSNDGLIAYRTGETQNKDYAINPYVIHVDKTTSTMYAQFVHINWGEGAVPTDNSITPANGWYESVFDIDYGEYAGEFGILFIS